MQSKLVETLALKHSPVAVVLTDVKPDGAIRFKEGGRGCVGAMLLAAAKGRAAVFDRQSFGCPGGGTGLGFGNCYPGFPIERLLSTGGTAALPGGQSFDMGEGERFHASPEVTARWLREFPFRDVPTAYVALKPLGQVAEGEPVAVVLMLANPDQLSALVTLAGFGRGSLHASVAPWGAACQSIVFAYAEGEKETPAGVIGFFDISQRGKIDRDLLSYAVPYRMFTEMEANVERSFLGTHAWLKLRERWPPS